MAEEFGEKFPMIRRTGPFRNIMMVDEGFVEVSTTITFYPKESPPAPPQPDTITAMPEGVSVGQQEEKLDG